MPRESPVALREFAALFNAGRFWDSHEALERPWRERRSEFYHGLILFASAFVHVQRGNRHGIRAQLEKAERVLEAFRPAYLGLDVEGLLRHARDVRGLLESDPHGDGGSSIPTVAAPVLELDPRHVRGDEPELRVP